MNTNSFFYFVLLMINSLSVHAQVQAVKRVHSIPYDLSVYNKPISYFIENDRVTINSSGETNLFNDPNGKYKICNAPMILFEPQGDFTLIAKVAGKLCQVYDVAALVIYQNEDVWAKLCYENSVNKKPTIVSVVTRTFSDDCNSLEAGDSAYLSIVKKGDQYSFFYSPDTQEWIMIRTFNLETKDKIKVGFAAHGIGKARFTGTFSEILFSENALYNMRIFKRFK